MVLWRGNYQAKFKPIVFMFVYRRSAYVRSAFSIFAAKGSWSPLQPVSAASISFDSYLVLTCRLKFNLMFVRVVLVSYKPYHYNPMMYRCYNITSQNVSSFCYGFSSYHYKCLLTFNTIKKSHGDGGVATYAGLTGFCI